MDASCSEVQDDFMQTSTSTFFGGSDEEPDEPTGQKSQSSTPTVCEVAIEIQAERKDLSDEGQELNRALLAAQRALEAARYFVNSPSLSRPSSAKAQAQLAPEVSSTSAPEALARRRRRSKRTEAVPRAEGPEGLSGKHRMVTMGEAAARARVRRAKSMEAAKRLKSEAEAEAHAAERAEVAAAVAAHRRRAARRAASEQRARHCAQKQEEELQALSAMRREEQRSMGLRYAKSASRRVESERVRREDLTRDILAGLHAEQAARREAAFRKGQELQQRCQDADFGHCKAVVESRRRRPKSLHSLRLPPIEPK